MQSETQKRRLSIVRDGKTSTCIIRSLNELNSFIKSFAKELKGGDVLALSGNLGAGKTTFTQRLAKTLGILENVTSPTFVLMKVYCVDKRSVTIKELCHIDAYRLESESDLEAIGAQDYIGRADALTVIEWPERVKEMIPKKAVWITLSTE